MKCSFCNLEKDSDFILETKHWAVYLAYNQSYLGSCVIILKRHTTVLSQLTEEEWLGFTTLVKKLESAIKKSFNPNSFNWSCLMNDAFKSQKPNPHVHWFVRPRYKDKVEFRNTVFIDSEFAHHYDNKRKFDTDLEVRKEVMSKLKENW